MAVCPKPVEEPNPPNDGVAEAAGVEPKPRLGVVVDGAPNAGVAVEPNAGAAAEEPKAGAGVLLPNAGVADAPNAGVDDAPKAGAAVEAAPNAGAAVVEPNPPNDGCAAG